MRKLQIGDGTLPDPLPTVIAGSEVGLLTEASQVLEHAETFARRCEAGARAAFRRAKADGYAAGYSEGAADGRDAIASLGTALKEEIRSVEEGLAPLVLELVTEVVGRTPEPEAVASLLARSLDAFRDGQTPAVALSTAARPALRAAVEAVLEDSPVPAVLRLDPALSPDGCELRLAAGAIDLSPRGRLLRIAEVLGVSRDG